MGNLTARMAESQPLRVLMLGLDNAGKSSVLARLCGEEVRMITPTRGFTVKALAVGSSQEAIKVWDLGGRQDLRSYWAAYYSKAEAIVFVVDATNRTRLAETSATLRSLLDENVLVGLPLVVLANKQDLPNALSAAEVRVVTTCEAVIGERGNGDVGGAGRSEPCA